MDIPENNHKKILLAIILIVIVAFVLFAVVWKTKTKKTAQTQTQTQTTAGNNTGIPTNLPAPPAMLKIPVPAEVTSISGTVEKIEGQTITVKAFFFGEQKTFSVTVGDATKIKKSEMKKEISKPEEGKPLELFTLTDASFTDIRQNDNLTIEAGENIKDNTGFVAKIISINIMHIPDISAPTNMPAPPAMPDLPTPPKI
jgi:hypothetical protein